MRRERSRRPLRRARQGEMYSLDDFARAMENEVRGFKAGTPRDLSSLVSNFADYQYELGQYHYRSFLVGGR